MPDSLEIESSVLKALVRVWRSASVDGALPKKAALDPVDLGRSGVMPHAWLLERVDNELVVRLAGEEIIAAMGRPVRGRRITDVYNPRSVELILGQWHRVLDACEVCHNKGVIVASMGNRYEGERIAVPVADEAGEPRFVFGATLYTVLHGLFASDDTVMSKISEPAMFTPYRDML